MGIVIKVQGISETAPTTLYDSESEVGIVTALEMSDENMKAASLTFDYRGDVPLSEYGTLIAMWLDSECAFFGRVIQVSTAYGVGGEKVRGVTCESAVGFLADSTVYAPPYAIPVTSNKMRYLFECVHAHNAGFGYLQSTQDANKQWVNARVSNNSVVPWEWLEFLNVRDRFDYVMVDGLDTENESSILERMQDSIDSFAIIMRAEYFPNESNFAAMGTSEYGTVCNMTAYRSDSEIDFYNNPITPDVIARHGMSIVDVSAHMGLGGVCSCVYATNKAGNEAYGENAALIAKYGRRQMKIKTDSEDQATVAAECAQYASNLHLLEDLECEIDYIDLSLIDGGYVRPKVGQLWHVHSAPLGIHLKGWVKSCTWSADEPWSSRVVLHYCTEIEPE